MPIYVYGCRKCGATEEHIQRFSDPPKTKCESCGGKLEKKVTSAAFHLKGAGWYRDGYASARPDAGDGGGSDAGAGSDAGGSDAASSTSAAADSSAPSKPDAKAPAVADKAASSGAKAGPKAGKKSGKKKASA